MTALPGSSLQVLLVEDNPNDAKLIRRYLGESDTALLPNDVEVVHERRLDDALSVLDEAEIDLLLLDLGLEKTSGLDTFERIEDRVETVPVIVLTGLQDEQAAVDMLQRGAQDFLNKGSLDRERLVKSVRYALERQEREAELKRTTDQLEILNRILRHDLQNDIQVLIGWSEALKGELDGERGDYVENILATTQHMRELAENSREYIQLVVGEDDVELEPVRVDEMLSVEIRKAQSAYPEAEFDVSDDLPAVSVAANEMLSSAFRNLLNNAVQHSHADVPRVDVTMTRRDDTVLVKIADNGPGLPDEQKETIFGKGEQGLDSDGTGIGLYLVHTLVTQFGGSVWVEDRAEQPWASGQPESEASEPTGAVFCVELPVESD